MNKLKCKVEVMLLVPSKLGYGASDSQQDYVPPE
jgi:hypothetical protein